MVTQEARKGESTPSKGTLQSYLQNFSKEAIDVLVEIMRTSRNENLKMGAAKVIIDKTIADLKAVEIGGVNGEPIKLNLITGADISQFTTLIASSEGSSSYGSSQVQGIGLAQAGEEDNNSNQSISKVESI